MVVDKVLKDLWALLLMLFSLSFFLFLSAFVCCGPYCSLNQHPYFRNVVKNVSSKIFLIGLMGSGKSYWGRHLANHFRYPFLDLDKGIEMVEMKTIAEIFEGNGEAYFRQKESEVLRSLTNNPKFVMSCGGGTPCFHNNMDWMLQHGEVVWLHPPLKTLAERLVTGKDKRPLLKSAKDEADIIKIMEAQQLARSLFYEKCHHIVIDPSPTLQTFENLLKHA